MGKKLDQQVCRSFHISLCIKLLPKMLQVIPLYRPISFTIPTPFSMLSTSTWAAFIALCASSTAVSKPNDLSITYINITQTNNKGTYFYTRICEMKKFNLLNNHCWTTFQYSQKIFTLTLLNIQKKLVLKQSSFKNF